MIMNEARLTFPPGGQVVRWTASSSFSSSFQTKTCLPASPVVDRGGCSFHMRFLRRAIPATVRGSVFQRALGRVFENNSSACACKEGALCLFHSTPPVFYLRDTGLLHALVLFQIQSNREHTPVRSSPLTLTVCHSRVARS